jgi:inorganic phosphate transporter, PiT family
MPDLALLSVIAIVLLALVFDFTNGFHDAANSIATVVSTRVLTPRMAVVWAAFFNFAAVLVFHTGVANTVGKTVDPEVVSEAVIFAGLAGAVTWNFLTWWLGLPTSSSHALIGGFAGAGVAKAGFSVLNAASLEKTILFIAVSPLLGMVLGFLLMLANLWLFRRATPARVDSLFRRSRRPPSAWATAATTPRRPWASSAPCWSAPATFTCRPTATCRSRTGW